MGSISGSGRSPGQGNDNPLQYSCLGNPMDRGACGGLQSRGLKELDTPGRLGSHARTLFLRQALDWNIQAGAVWCFSQPESRTAGATVALGVPAGEFTVSVGAGRQEERAGEGRVPKWPFPLCAALQGRACPRRTSPCKNPCLLAVPSPSFVLKQGARVGITVPLSPLAGLL